MLNEDVGTFVASLADGVISGDNFELPQGCFVRRTRTVKKPYELFWWRGV